MTWGFEHPRLGAGAASENHTRNGQQQVAHDTSEARVVRSTAGPVLATSQ